jgi:hypothetical protein
MNKVNIVWSAVASAALASIGILLGILGNGEGAVATGLASITFAILSTKE